MNTTVTKNPAIEFFRFAFIGVIVLWHFNNIVPIFKCGDFAVDFFFILAGAMLYRSYLVHPGQEPVMYTFKRIRRIIIEWVLTLIPVFIIKFRDWLFINGHLNTDNLFEYLLKFIHELLFLGQTGLYHGTSNYASWFISVLIIGGFILYAALFYFKDKSAVLLFPVFSLLSLVFVFSDGFPGWEVRGCFDLQLLKGTAEMALGATTYHIAERYQHRLDLRRHLVDLISICAIVLMVALLFNDREFAPYSILFSTLILVGCLTDNSLILKVFNKTRKLWITLGGVSFEMLLIHGLVKPAVSFAGIGNLPPVISTTLYFLLVIASAFGLKWINGKLSPIIFSK